jgi:hypothetical protein
MAARLKAFQSETTRAKIQAAQLINRLNDCAHGKVTLTQQQVQAIKILLDKSLPNLSDVKIDTGSQGITFNLNANLPAEK